MSVIDPKCKKTDHNVLVLKNTSSFERFLDYGNMSRDGNGFLGVIM